MIHPPLVAGSIDAPHEIFAMGDLRLESGEVIRDYRQSYVTHGTRNADGSNTVLVCASLTGNHHRLDFLMGPAGALDPARWHVIATDPIGNGLSTSPSNSALQPGMRFPRFGLRDMVAAQHRLLVEHLGIRHVHAVAGASMGGMQALQWAVSHPDIMDAVVAMTPMARTAPWSMLVAATARACLMADPAWTGDGFVTVPARGWLAYTGLMNALTTRTPTAVEHLASTAEAHAWFDLLAAQQDASGFDAHDYLYQSWAYEAHDVGRTAPFAGDTAAALGSIVARTLILAPPLDLLNPAAAARAAAAAIPGARFAEIPSVQGHVAASNLNSDDGLYLNRTIGKFLLETPAPYPLGSSGS